jgi:hypothetical protein
MRMLVLAISLVCLAVGVAAPLEAGPIVLGACEPVGSVPRGSDRPSVHLELALRAHVDSAILSGAFEQARRIWEPYGFDVVWSAERPSTVGPSDAALRVFVERGRPRSVHDRRGSAIGWIEFSATGRPLDEIHLSVGEVQVLIEESRMGARRLTDLPLDLRHRFVTQALGRGLAHEIGHYLLGSKRHGARGLMRTGFLAAELLADRLDGFRLEPSELTGLAQAGWLPAVDLMARAASVSLDCVPTSNH